jgi:hypothetical protein
MRSCLDIQIKFDILVNNKLEHSTLRILRYLIDHNSPKNFFLNQYLASKLLELLCIIPSSKIAFPQIRLIHNTLQNYLYKLNSFQCMIKSC